MKKGENMISSSEEKIYMSKAPIQHSYININFPVLSSSFNKKKPEYRFQQNYMAHGFSIMFFIGGILALTSTRNHPLIQIGAGLFMIVSAIFFWFHVKGQETRFDLKNKKFYSNTGESYDFDEIKAIQLLEYRVDDLQRYSKVQMNLVLDGLYNNRVCLMEGTRLSSMQKELEKLSKAIEKPRFDFTESEPVSISRFILTIVIVLTLIFFMFYISVGHMLFPNLFSFN